jgi:hypothetical protein
MLHFVACLRSQVRCSLSLSKAGVHLALLCPLIGILCLPSLAQYNTGLPTVGKTGSPTDSQTLIDAKQFLSGTVTDMCGAIAAACGQLGATGYPLGGTIDARGFTGDKVCSGSLTTTTMLAACVTGTGHNGGKLLLGDVHLYVDGPASGNYTDGTSGVGTPALIIPSNFWGIEGVSRGAGDGTTNGTWLSVCTGNGTPVTGCQHSFPQRKFTIANTTVSGTNPTSMTILINAVVTGYQGELAMVKGATGSAAGDNGTFAVQSMAASGSNTLVTVTVSSGTPTCSSGGCGSLILGTPILGFGGSST